MALRPCAPAHRGRAPATTSPPATAAVPRNSRRVERAATSRSVIRSSMKENPPPRFPGGRRNGWHSTAQKYACQRIARRTTEPLGRGPDDTNGRSAPERRLRGWERICHDVLREAAFERRRAGAIDSWGEVSEGGRRPPPRFSSAGVPAQSIPGGRSRKGGDAPLRGSRAPACRRNLFFGGGSEGA